MSARLRSVYYESPPLKHKLLHTSKFSGRKLSLFSSSLLDTIISAIEERTKYRKMSTRIHHALRYTRRGGLVVGCFCRSGDFVARWVLSQGVLWQGSFVAGEFASTAFKHVTYVEAGRGRQNGEWSADAIRPPRRGQP